MRALAAAYNAVVIGSAIVAGALVAVCLVLIVVDVSIRMAGYAPPALTIATVEYLLLYFTLLAAPWLVRQKAHVYVDALTARLPAAAARLVARLVYVICVVTALTFAYFGAVLLIGAIGSGLFEDRGIDIPQWLLYAPMPGGFALVAIEFARYLIGLDTMYVDRTTTRDSV